MGYSQVTQSNTRNKKKQHKRITIKLRDLIIAELIGAVISGIIGGLVHLAFNNFHLEHKVENVCDILRQKDQASCKKAIDSIMNSAETNIDNYTVNLE